MTTWAGAGLGLPPGAAQPPPSSAAIVVKRCNPFGHGTDRGPKHLMGGLYGPEYEGRIKWVCELPAEVRAFMTCRHGHRGQDMDLCRPHVAMIQKRMSGICPKCVMPDLARGLHEDIQRAQGAFARAYMAGIRDQSILGPLEARANQLCEAMNELVANGTCHRCPLTLHERS